MYCSKQDIIDRYGQAEIERYAWDTDTDQADDVKIDQACQDATETVDMYIAAVAKLPLPSTPPLLERLAAELARYYLQGNAALDEVRKRYEDALRALKDIAAGRASLGIAEQGGTTGPTVEALRGDDDRIFTRETLADF